MFLRDALQRCSQLESEVASVYETLASAHGVAPSSTRSWTDAARRARQRARLLHSLAEVSVAIDDDGPFLVQVTPQIAGIRRVVENVRTRVTTALDAETAGRAGAQLDATARDEVYASLLEVAEPVLRRVSRLMEAETRSAKRAIGDGARARESGRVRTPCLPAVS